MSLCSNNLSNSFERSRHQLSAFSLFPLIIRPDHSRRLFPQLPLTSSASAPPAMPYTLCAISICVPNPSFPPLFLLPYSGTTSNNLLTQNLARRRKQPAPPPPKPPYILRLHSRHTQQIFRIGQMRVQLRELRMQVRVLPVAVRLGLGEGSRLLAWVGLAGRGEGAGGGGLGGEGGGVGDRHGRGWCLCCCRNT